MERIGPRSTAQKAGRTGRRAISGSDVVGDSGQGYVHRRDCAEMAKKRNPDAELRAEGVQRLLLAVHPPIAPGAGGALRWSGIKIHMAR
jgi:hypothetical protein